MAASPSLLAAILLAAAAGVEALVFDVPSGGSKCLTEELRRGALSHASYRVAEATSAAASTVSARVAGPRGEELHLAEGVEAGDFRFEAAEDGKYTACFWTPRYDRGAAVSVDVQWDTGVRSHAQPAVAAAKEGGVDSITGELKKLEVSARLIHEEMISLHRSEDEMQMLNEDTAMKIHFFTLLSLAVCVGVAGLQLWHLKTFFQKRHIL
ncbi:transmembrane emp24 domain-containing protein p24delta9-like [Oryza brachyantha]|uniref:GOLD domain-containing protein n=1 Tax=Oryza brachyantha TaxID=4533 RepID=J3LNE5_ORYBR|nr:transmembrane emp24 domain-containing protein p24delta9-like [Oryza brachyantha]